MVVNNAAFAIRMRLFNIYFLMSSSSYGMGRHTCYFWASTATQCSTYVWNLAEGD
jgi:hypothetical protein